MSHDFASTSASYSPFRSRPSVPPATTAAVNIDAHLAARASGGGSSAALIGQSGDGSACTCTGSNPSASTSTTPMCVPSPGHRCTSSLSSLYACSPSSSANPTSSPSLALSARSRLQLPRPTDTPTQALDTAIASTAVPSTTDTSRLPYSQPYLVGTRLAPTIFPNQEAQKQAQRRHSVHHLPFQHQAYSLAPPSRSQLERQVTPTSIDWIFEKQKQTHQSQQGQCLTEPIASQVQHQTAAGLTVASTGYISLNASTIMSPPPLFACPQSSVSSSTLSTALALVSPEAVHQFTVDPPSSTDISGPSHMLLGTAATHAEALLNSLDVASSPSHHADASPQQPPPTDNSFDIDALLAQAAVDAHVNLAHRSRHQDQQQHSHSHALIPVTEPLMFDRLSPIPASLSRKRKRSAAAVNSSLCLLTSPSSLPPDTAVHWHPPSGPVPQLPSPITSTFDPLATLSHVICSPPHTGASGSTHAFLVQGPSSAASLFDNRPGDAGVPIPALSMTNPSAPAAGQISETVIGRLRVGQRRDYTVSRTPRLLLGAPSPPLCASDDDNDNHPLAADIDALTTAAGRRRPSLPARVEGRTSTARASMDSGHVPDPDLEHDARAILSLGHVAKVPMRGFALPDSVVHGEHVRSMPDYGAAAPEAEPPVLEIKFACEVGGMEPVKRRKMRKGKGGRKVPTASDAATGDAETECTSADEGDGDGRQQVFRRRGSTSSESSVDHVARAAADGDNKCPACDLPEGTLMRSSPLLCQACVAKRKRAVEAATRAFLDKHRGKMSECIACHEVKSVVHECVTFHLFTFAVRVLSRRHNG
ncbi:hypothetical protein BCR44DRAFT_279702 [Catenaria anguillulae PL171]|uniref:Uncharacterized protein n=1 Tax=Catenaria anguillulae PL171 TaxID=765915 RepID=A0A1Y2HQD8_9FUNG|nr:hypothetical protein BCR44DRAFT_279702 [Catenaria anguillulae PL171]